MTTFLIIGLIIAYLIIGGIISGLVNDNWSNDFGDRVLALLFWPIIAAAFMLGLICLGPIILGEKIKERIEKR